MNINWSFKTYDKVDTSGNSEMQQSVIYTCISEINRNLKLDFMNTGNILSTPKINAISQRSWNETYRRLDDNLRYEKKIKAVILI